MQSIDYYLLLNKKNYTFLLQILNFLIDIWHKYYNELRINATIIHPSYRRITVIYPVLLYYAPIPLLSKGLVYGGVDFLVLKSSNLQLISPRCFVRCKITFEIGVKNNKASFATSFYCTTRSSCMAVLCLRIPLIFAISSDIYCRFKIGKCWHIFSLVVQQFKFSFLLIQLLLYIN